MSTSSSFNVRIIANGSDVFDMRLDSLLLPHFEASAISLNASDNLIFAVVKPCNGASMRFRLGDELIATFPGEIISCGTDPSAWFRCEMGESCFVVEQEDSSGEGEFFPIFEIPLLIVPRPLVRRDFDVMVEDLTKIHEGLAHDVIARSHARYGIRPRGTARLIPPAVLEKLSRLQQKLSHAVHIIAAQPSKTLQKKEVVVNYRAGDHLQSASVNSFPVNSFDSSGSPLVVRRVRTRRPFLSEDTPEHRHIAYGIRMLERRALNIARHFETMAELLYDDASRWGGSTEWKTSVFESISLPRIAQLEEYAEKAHAIASTFGTLLRSNPFIAHAEEPRTPFGMTPVFCGRPAYREAYRALWEARLLLGVLVDGDSIRVAYRSLSRLYEYWCFVKTVDLLRARFGPPKPDPSIKLIHGIYRPELLPGQKFVFDAGSDTTVTITYESDIHPWIQAIETRDRYGASLTSTPLRPDIMIEVLSNRRSPAILILDAKSTDSFHNKKFKDITDYARQIIETKTMCQPVKQVFLLHRDNNRGPVTNLPHYFERHCNAKDAAIIGGIPCIPEHVGCAPRNLCEVIECFCELYLAE